MKTKKFCIDCGKEICYCNFLYGSKRCRSCRQLGKLNSMFGKKGKNNPNYINNKVNKKFYCKDCNVEISKQAKRCASCATKNVFKIGKRKYRKYYCIDCNKEINYRSKRCSICQFKNNSGKNNWFYGKPSFHGKHGYYKNISMRSSWEIKYAKYLDKNNIKWLYESKTFDLGNSTYTPDFYLPKTNEYIEIKGYFPQKIKAKLNKFTKMYSNINFKILQGKELNDLGIKIERRFT